MAPGCADVNRIWNSRGDAVTVANSCMGSCGWFVPCGPLLQNPAYACRTYWDRCCCTHPTFGFDYDTRYWSDTQFNTDFARYTQFGGSGSPGGSEIMNKAAGAPVRAMRCTPT